MSKGRSAETGNVLRPSTHLSVQMSVPPGAHPHVNVKALWARPPGRRGNRTYGKQAARKLCRVCQEPFTVSTTLHNPQSSPLRDTDSQMGRNKYKKLYRVSLLTTEQSRLGFRAEPVCTGQFVSYQQRH